MARAFRNRLADAKATFFRVAAEAEDEGAAAPQQAVAAGSQRRDASLPSPAGTPSALGPGPGPAATAALRPMPSSPPGGPPQPQLGELVSGPSAPLSAVRAAIVEEACRPCSGWDVAVEDLEEVLQGRVLLPHAHAAGVGAAAASSRALAPALRQGQSGGGGGGSGAGGDDVRVSWPLLADTLLYMYNR